MFFIINFLPYKKSIRNQLVIIRNLLVNQEFYLYYFPPETGMIKRETQNVSSCFFKLCFELLLWAQTAKSIVSSGAISSLFHRILPVWQLCFQNSSWSDPRASLALSHSRKRVDCHLLKLYLSVALEINIMNIRVILN